jgi:hypothetical protein
VTFSIIDVPADTTKLLAQLKAAGITDIIRYDDRFPSGGWKQIHSPEVHAIRDAGLRLGIVYEGAGSTLSSFSEQNGYLDAAYSRQQAALRGQPNGSAIYFAVDFDPSASDISTHIVPYFRGVATAFAELVDLPKLATGVYGSGLTCKTLKDAGLVTLTWITCSRGFAGSKEYVAAGLQDLWQESCDQTLLGLSVDYNTANPASAGQAWGSFVPWGAPAIPAVIPAPPPISHDARWLQTVLQKAGLYNGQIDGNVGPLTVNGAIAYMEKKGET